MIALRSFSKGIREALLRPKAAVILWLVNAAFAAVVYFVAAGAVTEALGRSLAADDLLSRSERRCPVRVPDRAGRGADGPPDRRHRPASALSIRFAAALWRILHDLLHPHAEGGFAPSFWSGAGRYYGRFLRVIPASLILWVPAAALYFLVDRVLDSLGADPLKEQLNFYLTFVRIALAIFLFFLVRMTMDYARIRIAVTEARSALGAVAWAASFVLRKLGGSLVLYYALGLTALLGSAFFLGLQSLFGKRTSRAVLLGFS